MPITDTQNDAIIWSELFPNYNREKSYIKCEIASSCRYKGKDMYNGTFVVHIYRKGDFHFECGIDANNEYQTNVRRA